MNDIDDVEFDPFDEGVNFSNTQDSVEETIAADNVSTKSVNSNKDDADDFAELISASASPVEEATEESVASHVSTSQQVSEENVDNTPGSVETNSTDNKTVQSAISIPTTAQDMANKLAVLFEAPVYADKVSVPYSSPKSWNYNFRLQSGNTVIHLCQMNFDDDMTLKLRLNPQSLTQADKPSLRLMLLQAMLISFNLGKFAYYHRRLIFIPETLNPVINIVLTQVEFSVEKNGEVDIKVVDNE